MTQRGTLAYYFVALAAGPFFMVGFMFLHWAVTKPGHDMGGIGGFIASYVLSLVTGGFTAILFAFLLRYLGEWTGNGSALRWITIGAGLSLSLVWILAQAWEHLMKGRRTPQTLAELLLLGPAGVKGRAIWLAIPAGMATGYLLFKVYTRFAATHPAEPERNT